MCFVIANYFLFACLFLFAHASCVFKLLCGFLFFKNWNRDTVGVFCGIVPATRLCPSNVETICWGSLEEDLDADIIRGIDCYLLAYLLTYLLIQCRCPSMRPFHKEHKGT